MARRGRVEFEGAVYHVLDRGDRQEPIARSDGDRAAFVRTLGETCERTGWRVHAFVLMGNHYHLLIETPQANLVAGMRWFQTTWTVRFNRYHRLSGHLFQGRYKAVVVDPEERGYFVTLSDYIHLNPVRAGIVGLNDRLFDYRWSSYRWYAASAGRCGWFEPSRVMGDLGLDDTTAGRRLYAERMRARAVEERTTKEAPGLEEIRRGWCLGGPSFRERMLALLEANGRAGGAAATGALDATLRRSHGEDQALKIVQTGLRLYEMTGIDLPSLKKNDPRKVAIAAVVRRRTAVPNAWIARALHLGHVSRVSRCWNQQNELTARLEAALA